MCCHLLLEFSVYMQHARGQATVAGLLRTQLYMPDGVHTSVCVNKGRSVFVDLKEQVNVLYGVEWRLSSMTSGTHENRSHSLCQEGYIRNLHLRWYLFNAIWLTRLPNPP